MYQFWTSKEKVNFQPIDAKKEISCVYFSVSNSNLNRRSLQEDQVECQLIYFTYVSIPKIENNSCVTNYLLKSKFDYKKGFRVRLRWNNWRQTEYKLTSISIEFHANNCKICFLSVNFFSGFIYILIIDPSWVQCTIEQMYVLLIK